MNVALVGFMGSGKSVAGKKLAEKLGFGFVDTDELIEKSSGKKVSKIFQEDGEEKFRELEKKAVKKAGKMDGVVIATGGGAVLNDENLDNLKKNGPVVLLKVSAEQVFERVKGQSNRPLLQVKNPLEKIRELLEKRAEFYDKADYTVDTDGQTPTDTAEEVFKIIKNDSSAALAQSDLEAFE